MTNLKIILQRVHALPAFWDLEKSVLHEIYVSGTAVDPLLTQKSPINQGSGNCVSDFV